MAGTHTMNFHRLVVFLTSSELACFLHDCPCRANAKKPVPKFISNDLQKLRSYALPAYGPCNLGSTLACITLFKRAGACKGLTDKSPGANRLVQCHSSEILMQDCLMQMGELEMHPETPRTPMQKAVNSLTNYLQATIGAVQTPRRHAARSAQSRSTPMQQPIPESSMPGKLPYWENLQYESSGRVGLGMSGS